MCMVFVDELAGVHLRGFALAFDRLPKASTFVSNANFSNCISEVSCSLLSFSLLLLKSVTNLFKPWESLTNEWGMSFVTDSILISTPYLPCKQQVATSNTGPILVFPRIQPFGSVDVSSLGDVYSRHVTGSCKLWDFFSVLRHEILSDINRCQESCISTKFNHTILLWQLVHSFWVPLQWIFLRRIIGRRCKCFHQRTFRHKQWVTLSYQTSLPVQTWQDLYSSHNLTAPWILSCLTEIIVRKTVSIVPESAQLCIDNFPPPLLLSTPRDNGLVDLKTGCSLSPNFTIISSATLSHSPCADPHPRNDHHPGDNIFEEIETSLELNSHSCSCPVKSTGSTLILVMNSWTL